MSAFEDVRGEGVEVGGGHGCGGRGVGNEGGFIVVVAGGVVVCGGGREGFCDQGFVS